MNGNGQVKISRRQLRELIKEQLDEGPDGSGKPLVPSLSLHLVGNTESRPDSRSSINRRPDSEMAEEITDIGKVHEWLLSRWKKVDLGNDYEKDLWKQMRGLEELLKIINDDEDYVVDGVHDFYDRYQGTLDQLDRNQLNKK